MFDLARRLAPARVKESIPAAILRGEGVPCAPWASYAAAAALFGVALLARLTLLPVEGGLAFLTFYPAVGLAALLFGAGPGLLAVALGAVTAQVVFMPPYWALKLSLDQALAVATFGLSGAIICFLAHQMRRHAAGLKSAMAALARREADLSAANARLRELDDAKSLQLLAALHRLAAHLGNSPLAIVEFDPQFRVIRWSNEAERLFGWTVAEMTGRAIAEMRWVHEDDAQAVLDVSAEMLAGTRPRNMCANRNYRKDGTVVHCEWYNSALYAADGQLVSILSQVLDVSERQHALAELSAAKEAAEQANRAKSIFLANMSHEIRTPLHVIVGLGHLLRRDLADPVLQQRVDQLCAHSDHLLALLNDVLDLAKVEADRLVLDDEAFRLGSVAERVLEVVGRPAHEKGLAVVVDVAPALSDAVLRGDGLRLAQILINLGSNAVKFTERGTVRLEIVARAEDAQRMTLEFSVADTGIGLAAADQARLFQVFSQVDGSATRRHGGSGLGLAISQRLAALMGGRIDVVSTHGRGSRFTFALTLPRAAGLPEASSPAADLVGRRVLFAEDHPLSQDILFEMLDDLGCDVDVASDGAEAVECAQVRDYDLILMDMQMPKLDGLEATRAIRALPRHRDTPIVALTANAFAEDRLRCLDAGMNGHLGKPVTPASLAAALGQWLGVMRSPAAARAVASPEMMARFIAEQRQTLPCLRAHLVAGERDPAYVLAHNLKGISGLLDVRRMAELADDLAQRLCGGADPATLVPLADACAAELQELVAALGDLPQA